MNNSRYKPVFIKGFRVKLGFLKILKRYFFMPKKYPLFKRSLIKQIKNNSKLNKDLLFTKNAIFNGMYYFSPSVPGFPSKAFDKTAERGGLNFFEMGTEKKNGIESLFLAISSRCPLNCRHCYEKHNLNGNGNGVETEKWKEIINTMQTYGTNVIIFTGGEPLVEFKRLIELLDYGNKDLSDFHIHTSGWELTDSMVKKMKSAGLKSAAVGLDDFNEARFDILRGKKGAYRTALNALELFNQNGIMTYVNTCISREFLKSGDLYKFFELMKEYNVSFIQMLEPRPWGGYINSNGEEIYSERNKSELLNFVRDVSTSNKYRNFPIAYYIGNIESPKNLGCTMGGLSHMHIDSAGNVNPCVFLPVSFGNINEENFSVIFHRMKEVIKKPVKKECPSVVLRKEIEERIINEGKIPLSYEKIKHEFDKAIDSFTPNRIYEDDD